MFFVIILVFFFFNDTATTGIYTYRHTLSLHDALPISGPRLPSVQPTVSKPSMRVFVLTPATPTRMPNVSVVWLATIAPRGLSFSLLSVYRSEEHTSELQSLMRISYAVFCLKKKKK